MLQGIMFDNTKIVRKLICVKDNSNSATHYFDGEEKEVDKKVETYGKEGAIVHVMRSDEYPNLPTKEIKSLDTSNFICPFCNRKINSETIMAERT